MNQALDGGGEGVKPSSDIIRDSSSNSTTVLKCKSSPIKSPLKENS